MNTDGDAGAVKSAGRALAVLSLVAERESLRFSDILRELDLARSSGHGLLRTMTARGWLEHDPESHQYSLGLRAWQVGQRYTGHRDVANLAAAVMEQIVAEVGETVQIARLDGIENVYIAIRESPHPMRLASSVGLRLHAHATALGKALLAQLDPAETQSRLSSAPLPRFTDHTLTDVDALMHKIDEVRARGYALDEEEYLDGCRCVAVPFASGHAGLLVAISITAPSNRCGPDWPDRPLEALQRGARQIEQRLNSH